MNTESQENAQKGCIVIAAGGTGGHIFPAQTVQDKLLKIGYKAVFVSDKRYLNYTTSKKYSEHDMSQNTVLKIISADSFSLHRSIFRKILSGVNIVRGIIQSLKLLIKLKAELIVSFGGYPVFPVLVAAKILNKKIIIAESNTVLGKTSAIFAKDAERILLGMENSESTTLQELNDKVVLTGNPVKEQVMRVRKSAYQIADGKINLFVTGGSQGAKIINQSVVQAFEMLTPEERGCFLVTQQCTKNEDLMRQIIESYKKLDMIDRVTIKPFFTNMADIIGESHLIISRSGSMSITEIAVIGRPSILVPIPKSMKNHQYLNAHLFEKSGGCIVVKQDQDLVKNLAENLRHIIRDPKFFRNIAKKSKTAGELHINATNTIVDIITQSVQISK